jgi:DNA sulfur modification protein DndB
MNHHINATQQSKVSHVSIKELMNRVAIGSMLVREVKKHHVKSVRQYIMENVESKSVYLPSLVFHLNHGSLDEWRQGEISVIDGSHRIVACIQLNELAQKIVKGTDQELSKKAGRFLTEFHSTHFAVQLYQGYTKEERDQLYLDFNSKHK